LRQPAVEALDALHVDRIGRLIQQGTIVRHVRPTWWIQIRFNVDTDFAGRSTNWRDMKESLIRTWFTLIAESISCEIQRRYSCCSGPGVNCIWGTANTWRALHVPAKENHLLTSLSILIRMYANIQSPLIYTRIHTESSINWALFLNNIIMHSSKDSPKIRINLPIISHVRIREYTHCVCVCVCVLPHWNLIALHPTTAWLDFES
jgi:hypothetical protein